MLQHVESIFGEQEARKRIIITADNVPQDESGLRQLIVSSLFLTDSLTMFNTEKNKLLFGLSRGLL